VEAYPIMQQHWTLGRQIVREAETTLVHLPLNAPGYKCFTEQYVTRHWIYFNEWEKYNGSCINTVLYVPCHSLDSWSPTSHHEGLSLIPRQSIWDLWWTLWPEACFSICICFACPYQLPFHQSCIFIHLWSGTGTTGPPAATVSRNSVCPHPKNKRRRIQLAIITTVAVRNNSD